MQSGGKDNSMEWPPPPQTFFELLRELLRDLGLSGLAPVLVWKLFVLTSIFFWRAYRVLQDEPLGFYYRHADHYPNVPASRQSHHRGNRQRRSNKMSKRKRNKKLSQHTVETPGARANRDFFIVSTIVCLLLFTFFLLPCWLI